MRAGQLSSSQLSRGQPAQREPVEKVPPANSTISKHAEHEAGDRIADQHDERGQRVEARALAHRLGDAERDRDQVDDQEGPQPEADRDRQLLLDQLPDVLVVQEAAAEVEAQRSCPASRRSARAPACRSRTASSAPRSASASTVAARRGSRRRRRRRCAARASAMSCSTGPPGTNWMTMKVIGQRAEQRRHHQQQALEDVAQHRVRSLRRVGSAWPGP